mgnify:CR=1 FL=1
MAAEASAASLAAEQAAREECEAKIRELEAASHGSVEMVATLRTELAEHSDRFQAYEAENEASSAVHVQQSEEARAALSSLRAELAVAHDARAEAVQSQESEAARSTSLEAQLGALQSESDAAKDLAERDFQSLSSELRAEAQEASSIAAAAAA